MANGRPRYGKGWLLQTGITPSDIHSKTVADGRSPAELPPSIPEYRSRADLPEIPPSVMNQAWLNPFPLDLLSESDVQ